MAKKPKPTPITEGAIVELGFKLVSFESFSAYGYKKEEPHYYYEYEFKNVDLTLIAERDPKKSKWRVNIYEGGTSYFRNLEELKTFMQIVKSLKPRN